MKYFPEKANASKNINYFLLISVIGFRFLHHFLSKCAKFLAYMYDRKKITHTKTYVTHQLYYNFNAYL